MALSAIVRSSPTNLNTCERHKDGNGRECEWTSDSEKYDVNTFEAATTMTPGR